MKESEFTEKFDKFLSETHRRLYSLQITERWEIDDDYDIGKCFHFKFGSKFANDQDNRAHGILRESIAIAFDIKLEEG